MDSKKAHAPGATYADHCCSGEDGAQSAIGVSEPGQIGYREAHQQGYRRVCRYARERVHGRCE